MVKITGAKAHSARLRGMASEEMVRDVGKALVVAGRMIESEAHVLIMEGSAAGHAGGKHQHIRSLPGQPPNNEYGDLVRGLQTDPVEPLKVEVSANAGHSVPLEFGTSKMAERPFMRPATQRKRKEAVDLVAKAIRTAVRRNGGKAS